MQTFANPNASTEWPDSSRSLRDHVAVVTGGTSGIGRATCSALLAEGVRLALVGRQGDKVMNTVRALRKEVGRAAVEGLVADVRDERDTEQMAADTLRYFGTIDILVASAGTGTTPKTVAGRSGVQLTVDDWNAVLDTNLKGLFLSARAVLPTMMDCNRGEIVSVASARCSLRGLPFAAAYSASKFGVIGLTQALAEEVREYGIRVQTVLPDVTDTTLLRQTSMTAGLGALLPAADVAAMIVSLLKLPADTALDRPLLAPYSVSGATNRM